MLAIVRGVGGSFDSSKCRINLEVNMSNTLINPYFPSDLYISCDDGMILL